MTSWSASFPSSCPSAAEPSRATSSSRPFSPSTGNRRKQAEETKRTLAAKTPAAPLWDGVFLQPRNTKVFSNFAETRTYRYPRPPGRHPGPLRLRPRRRAPRAGARGERGRGRLRGPLSIYGNTVIVDHGLACRPSTRISRPSRSRKAIGFGRSRTWDARATPGSPWGDHLHFEVLIGGISVTPVEWWMRDGSATTSVGRCGRRACSSSSRSCPSWRRSRPRRRPRRRRAATVSPPSQPTTKAESPRQAAEKGLSAGVRRPRLQAQRTWQFELRGGATRRGLSKNYASPAAFGAARIWTFLSRLLAGDFDEGKGAFHLALHDGVLVAPTERDFFATCCSRYS